MPALNIASPTPQGYYVTGQATTYGPGGISNSRYNASVTPNANAGQAFTSSLASGAAFGAMLRAKREQEEIHEGCMARLGWIEE